jgi:hypothetical protein
MEQHMKKLLFLCLLSTVAFAQIPTTIKVTNIRFTDGTPPVAYLYSDPPDSAKDNTIFNKVFRYNLAGRQINWGIDITQLWDTISAPNLVLEGSVDSSNWKGVDSITAIPIQTVGHYEKITNLYAIQYAYWRVRLGTASMLFHGNILNPGAIKWFILTPLLERY